MRNLTEERNKERILRIRISFGRLLGALVFIGRQVSLTSPR